MSIEEMAFLLFSQAELSRVVLSTTLTPREDLFAREVAHSFENATLLELSSHTFVNAILDSINVLIASDFGLVQVIYFWSVNQFTNCAGH